MPHTDPSFLIGVIREKEKQFLDSDRYVRIVQSPSVEGGLAALSDTVYGRWMKEPYSVAGALAALDAHAKEEMDWIFDYLDAPRVRLFVSAQADALNIVDALFAWKQGEPTFELSSQLGSLSQEKLFDAVWNNVSLTGVGPWGAIIADERARAQEETWSQSQVLGRMAGRVVEVLFALADTPLMRELAALVAHKAMVEVVLRKQEPLALSAKMITSLHGEALAHAASVPELVQALTALGYTQFSTQALEEVESHIDATAYELAWDTELLHAVRRHRLDVSGYDPIIAYWFGKQMEGRSLRFMISAKASGMSEEKVQSFLRPYYQYSFL